MWEDTREGRGGCETREPVAVKSWGVVWIEGGPMDEIGLAEKSPRETAGWGGGWWGGREIANLGRGIKEVKSGIGGRDLGIGIRAGC